MKAERLSHGGACGGGAGDVGAGPGTGSHFAPEHGGVCARIDVSAHLVVIGHGSLLPASSHGHSPSRIVKGDGELVVARRQGDGTGYVPFSVGALVVHDQVARFEAAVLILVYPEDGTVVTASAEGNGARSNGGAASHHEIAFPEKTEVGVAHLIVGASLHGIFIPVHILVGGPVGVHELGGQFRGSEVTVGAIDGDELVVTRDVVPNMLLDAGLSCAADGRVGRGGSEHRNSLRH